MQCSGWYCSFWINEKFSPNKKLPPHWISEILGRKPKNSFSNRQVRNFAKNEKNSLPTNFQILNFKKGRIGRLMLTTLYFGKVEVKGTIFFYIESVKVDP
jgi:hypothetical protein